MSDDAETEWGLVMPFLVCVSQGGPYEDAAYVAGWEAGALDNELRWYPMEEGESRTFDQAFHAANRSQLDLIAMKHGLTAEFVEAGESETWLTLIVTVMNSVSDPAKPEPPKDPWDYDP